MKHLYTTIIAVICCLVSCTASAQKHHLYADAGISLSQFMPGASVTYNFNFIPYIGIGAGVQGYGFFPTRTNGHTFVPAVYGDVRFNIRPKKRNQFFVLLDVGMNFYNYTPKNYTENNWVYFVDKNNGIYSSLGFGYFNRFTKRGGGIYGTIKTVTNHYQLKGLNLITGEAQDGGASRGTLAVACGFRW